MIFDTIINNSDAVISFVTHLTHLGTHHMGTVNMEQVNHIGDLVSSLKGQMQQHLIDNGVSLCPLSTLASLTNSLIQIADHHNSRYHVTFFLNKMPIFSDQEGYHYVKQAAFHIETTLRCQDFGMAAPSSIGLAGIWKVITKVSAGIP